MKNAFLKFPLLALILFSFSSCQDDFDYPNQYTVYIDGVPYSGEETRFSEDNGTLHIHIGRNTQTGYQLQFGSHSFSGTGTYTNDRYFHLWQGDNYYHESDDYTLTITEYEQNEYIKGTFTAVTENTDNPNDVISVTGDFSYSVD